MNSCELLNEFYELNKCHRCGGDGCDRDDCNAGKYDGFDENVADVGADNIDYDEDIDDPPGSIMNVAFYKIGSCCCDEIKLKHTKYIGVILNLCRTLAKQNTQILYNILAADDRVTNIGTLKTVNDDNRIELSFEGRNKETPATFVLKIKLNDITLPSPDTKSLYDSIYKNIYYITCSLVLNDDIIESKSFKFKPRYDSEVDIYGNDIGTYNSYYTKYCDLNVIIVKMLELIEPYLCVVI